MVNQVILKYFRENQAKHSLADLKKEVIGSGYPKKDVDEVVAVLKGEVGKTSVPKVADLKPVARKPGVPSAKFSGIRWMRFAGILGIVFLVLGVLNVLSGFFGFGLSLGSSLAASLVLLVVAIVLIVLVCFYFYGFLRMGRAVDSKLLRVAAVMNIVGVILMIVMMIAMVAFTFFMVRNIGNSLSGGDMDVQLGITGNAIGGLGGLGGIFWLFIIVGVLFLLYLLTTRVLFSVALIRIRDKVRFTKIAGILGLIVVSSMVIYYVIYLAMGPFMLMSLLSSSGSGMLGVFMVVGIGISILAYVTLLFESLALFDASKKFEN